MQTIPLKFLLVVSIILQMGPLRAAAQNAPAPEECEALAVWESSREDRIEQEFRRRGISNSVEKQLHRAEIEQIVDQRIRTLRELCEQKKSNFKG